MTKLIVCTRCVLDRNLEVLEKAHLQDGTPVPNLVYTIQCWLLNAGLTLKQPLVLTWPSRLCGFLSCPISFALCSSLQFLTPQSGDGWKALGDHKGSPKTHLTRPGRHRCCLFRRAAVTADFAAASQADKFACDGKPRLEGSVLQCSSPSSEIRLLSCHAGCCPGSDKCYQAAEAQRLQLIQDNGSIDVEVIRVFAIRMGSGTPSGRNSRYLVWQIIAASLNPAVHAVFSERVGCFH